VLTSFNDNPLHKIYKIFSVWEHSCSMGTDRWTDMAKLTAPKNIYNNLRKLNLYVTITAQHDDML
jgi:hypothetical protein